MKKDKFEFDPLFPQLNETKWWKKALKIIGWIVLAAIAFFSLSIFISAVLLNEWPTAWY